MNNDVRERAQLTRDRAWVEGRDYAGYARSLLLFSTKAIVTLNGGGLLVLATVFPYLKVFPNLQLLAPGAMLAFILGLGCALLSSWKLFVVSRAYARQRISTVLGIDAGHPPEAVLQVIRALDDGSADQKWAGRLGWGSALAFGLGTLVLCSGLALDTFLAATLIMLCS